MFQRTAPLVLSLALLAAGCTSTTSSTQKANGSATSVIKEKSTDEAEDRGPWLRPTAELQRQIDERSARMQFLNNLDQQVEMIQWFVAQGELAYPTLLELAGSADDRSAGLALAALGTSKDGRLVEHLSAVPMPGEDRPNVRLERARCHMNLGDWSHAGILVDGLRSDDLRTRAQCAAALRRATQRNFSYSPQAEAADREAATQAWEEWLAAYRADPLRQR